MANADTMLTTGPSVDLDPTLVASGPGSAANPVVRAGRIGDDLELQTIDPRRYVVGQELARGGMGRILAARDRRHGRTVAIKELLVDSPELRARFEREARITARLQHPAIVNLLEAGVWPSGEPFYVMKLVTGESLDKAVARCPTLDARLALLPNVIAAADALAYAHGQRVIHRDLKPANVLVGRFGETVVIDWGLATDLADGSNEVAASPTRAEPGQLDHTVAGSVLGTPAYMPVEQALGNLVDERADVYALGAMLYHVLAGAPPYTGTTSELTLDAVIAGPPPPLAACSPGVPADLVTIVTRAMARAPAERYPTANELAEDLKKFQTGQLVGAHHYSAWQLVRRWAHRRRAPLAVAAVAVMLLGALGGVSVRRIVREQARAEQGRRDAEELMNFILLDMSANLEPLGRLDLLEGVAMKAVAYYDQREASGSDAELRTRALARRNLGDVLKAQGHSDQALEQYQASIAIVRELVANVPTDPRWQHDLAVGHVKIGDLLLAQGEATARALVEYRAALAIATTLAALDPANASRQQYLAGSHIKIGDVLLAEGDAAGALAAYRVAMTIRGTLAAHAPPTAIHQRDLWINHAKIGDVLLAQGDATAALAAHRAAMEIARTLAASDPADTLRQRDLSVSHERIGDVLLAQGDTAAALASHRAATEIARTLATNDPTDAVRQRDLSVGHAKVGNVLLAQGDTTNALVEYRAAMAIARALVARDPSNTEWQRELSVNHEQLGDVLLERGDATGALAEYRAAMEISRTLAANDPGNALRQRDLSVNHEGIGDALLAQGDSEAALADYREAMTIAQTLATKDPTNPLWQRDLSIGHEKVGDALLAGRDHAGGLAELHAGLAIARRLQAADPTNAEVDTQVTRLTTKIETCCRATGTPRPR